MPRGTKPGAVRGKYRAHSRRRKVSDDDVRAIRAAETLTDAEMYLVARGINLRVGTLHAIRRRARKANVPDLPPQ